MNRVLLGVLATLAVGLALIGWRAHELTKSLAASEENNKHLQQAIGDLNTAVADGIAERARLDNLATDAVRRGNQDRREAAAARAALERLKRTHEELRAYLDGAVPGPVAGWLWLPACGGDQGGEAVPAGVPGGANPETCSPAEPVSHQDGWQWCRDMERAVDSCNADKAALREWAAGAKQKTEATVGGK